MLGGLGVGNSVVDFPSLGEGGGSFDSRSLLLGGMISTGGGSLQRDDFKLNEDLLVMENLLLN